MLILDFVEDDLQPIPTLEGDEEVKLKAEETIPKKCEIKSLTKKNTETWLKTLTLNKLLTRLWLLLLSQTKARNNSNKLKNEIKQILYLLYQHNKITDKSLQLNEAIIIMDENIWKKIWL